MAFIPENLPRFDTVSFGAAGGSEPVVNYIARTDGLTQGWNLSEEITLQEGWSVEVDVLYVTDSSTTRALFTPSGTAYLPANGGSEVSYRRQGQIAALVSLDGGEYMDTNTFNFDGDFHHIKFIAETQLGISAIFYDLNNSGRNIVGSVFNFVVRNALGTIVNRINLTNKSEGATQSPSVGSVSATMMNYSEDVWEVKPEQVEYVARLDPVAAQYWQLSESIDIASNDDFEMSMMMLVDDSNFYALGSDTAISENRIAVYNDGSSIIGMGLSGSVSFTGLGIFALFKVSRVSGDISVTFNGNEIASSTGENLALTISRIGGKFEGDTSVPNIEGFVSNFSFVRNGVEEISIPLTNKEQGATQLPATGSVSATMPNYTRDAWEVAP